MVKLAGKTAAATARSANGRTGTRSTLRHTLCAPRLPMPAIRPPTFWPTLAATVGLLRHPRPGLAEPAALPRIERSLAAATLDPAWLRAYRDIIGLASEHDQTLAPLTLQIAAAPLHLAI